MARCDSQLLGLEQKSPLVRHVPMNSPSNLHRELSSRVNRTSLISSSQSPSSGVFTSESVTEGHPDKICDFVADRILDACLEQDSLSRLACEVFCKGDSVVLGGEIGTRADIDLDHIVRSSIASIGYTDDSSPFSSNNVRIIDKMDRFDFAGGGEREEEGGVAEDQGIIFGYATAETHELMPLPIMLAHQITNGLAKARHSDPKTLLRPDGKAQVTISYEEDRPSLRTVVVSTQHSKGAGLGQVRAFVKNAVLMGTIGTWLTKDTEILINPYGVFEDGGPVADCGVTGRKTMVDSYGGWARHGGGAFSGKDPTKVDRSAAYFLRYVCREVVKRGLAKEAEIQVAYAPGRREPVSLSVRVGEKEDAQRAEAFVARFNFNPRAMIAFLGLRRPIYASTSNYGHFGRRGFSWEA